MAERGDGTSWQRRVARVAAGAALVTAIALSTPLRAVVGATAADGEARRPTKPPAGARWQCKDGTYSFVVSRAGACWGHRGVARALSSAARPVPAATPATTKKVVTPAKPQTSKPTVVTKATKPAPTKATPKSAPKKSSAKPASKATSSKR